MDLLVLSFTYDNYTGKDYSWTRTKYIVLMGSCVSSATEHNFGGNENLVHTKAKLLQLKLTHLFAREVLLVKKNWKSN